jgi:hopanoid biosynthesis associated protein HpnK
MGATRQLIVNADDFGRSSAINHAVVQAHQRGIVTSASLMVNEPPGAEAVQMARDNPKLGVGLHLALICGRSALGPDRIPGLVDARQRFTDNPVRAGTDYFFRRELRPQLRAEIRAQLQAFARTGLKLDHVNGHLHLHLHPVVLEILLEEGVQFGVRCIRLTREPFDLDWQLARGNWADRILHALVFSVLGPWAAAKVRGRGLRHTDQVFGLLQNARVDTDYVCRLLPALPAGVSELYSHPSLDDFKHELDALVSPRTLDLVRSEGIQLVRYQDL